jgi:diaminopimelate decarboxylase
MNNEHITKVLRKALDARVYGGTVSGVLFYDLDFFRDTITDIQKKFPPATLHAIAVKANPLAVLLREACALGMGAECASLPEVHHALRLGFVPDKIVFDSPAKTQEELALAVEKGIYINVDNFQELERLAKIAASSKKTIRAGIRINSQTGAGSYIGTSTAIPTSKFGVPLSDNPDKIIEAYCKYPWLVGLHIHTGSQFCSLELVVQGVELIVKLAAQIADRRGKPIELIDIGGGLPANYGDDNKGTNLERYLELLHQKAPELFKYKLVTEFGRAVSAKAGWAASRVEYTKRSGGAKIAVVHLGADFMVRTAYVPDVWKHRVSVFGGDGNPKLGDSCLQDIAGPLCFTNDYVAKGCLLPEIEQGDTVVIHDVGAYTLSMWSRYNSRPTPAVYGYEINGDSVKLKPIKPAESVDDVLRFWGK